MTEKEDMAAMLKTFQSNAQTAQRSLADAAKIAKKSLEHTIKKNNNKVLREEPAEEKPKGPTVSDVWLQNIVNSAKQSNAPLKALDLIEKMIEVEKSKLEHKNKVEQKKVVPLQPTRTLID
jgi:hypothetical protein